MEWRAYWVGRVNRSDLEAWFGVSTPQASLDFRGYQESAPGNLEYDATQKAYLPTSTFDPRYLRPSADRYLRQAEALLNGTIQPRDTWFGSVPPISVMETVQRPISNELLRTVLRCIEQRRELEIEYLSLSSSKARKIYPHALASDGNRWHIRAWCCEHNDFRDFVLARIVTFNERGPATFKPSDDRAWFETIDVRIGPHPRLTRSQRKAIERDFSMKEGTLIINTRVALAYYLLRRFNLDLDDDLNLAPERRQIVLLNLDEVLQAIKSIR
jgi:hypothetical protein